MPHPDTPPKTKTVAVREQRIVVAAFLSLNGKLLLARRAAHKRVAPDKWHLPGGHVEFGEDPDQALKRELREEFGVETIIGAPVRSFSYVWDGAHTVGIVHEVQLTDPTQVLGWSNDEFQACAWVGENELADYLAQDDHNFHAAKAGFSRLHNSRRSDSSGYSPTDSDGYHTLDELYAHRNHLFMALMRNHPQLSWRAREQEDGTMDEGWFIAGMHLPSGDISYHLPLPMWEMLDGYGIATTTRAPKWDGHGATEVVKRLAAWTGG